MKKQTSFTKLAHRGALLARPENTLLSFQQALEEGFDGIELDVQTCASGEVIVFHDTNLLRLTGVDALVAETTWTEITKLSVQGQPIPLLSEVVEKLPKTLLYIELKDLSCGPAVEMILDQQKTSHKYVVGSKYTAALQSLSNATTDIAFISAKFPYLPKSYIKKYRITHFVSHHWITNWLGVHLAKRNNITYWAYPIQSRLVHKILQRHGIDGAVYDKYL